METFNKIHIESVNGDISIIEGGHLSFINASHYVKDECLYVSTINNEVQIIIPANSYEEIKVTTVNSDCSITLNDSSIKELIFNSTNGDLHVDADYDSLFFDSINGDCDTNRKIRNKPVTKTKVIPTEIIDDDGEVWVEGERYK